MIDRRSFVKLSAGLAAGGLVGLERAARALASKSGHGGSIETIGVQLYTVRDLMESDVRGTLEKVASLGYDEVEFAGYFGHSPEEIKAILDDVGLAAPAAHISLEDVRRDLRSVISSARAIGHRFVICPSLPHDERGDLDSYRELAQTLNEAGRACRDEGLRCGWHNHAFEFEKIDGRVPYDLLLEETEPELVVFEIDLFWTISAGADPIDYFERYPGRFSLCHVKDMAADGTMVDVGAGEIDFGSIFGHAETAGLVHYVVEHDEPADAISSITASYEHLSALAL
jgi:sugar phosphate isomerase/epimerase